ncbi:unnamed protein product [Brachionus calyciflorus]|uniref:Uncharacterized protein n=1 Tax=Brachionus calyciflorus TaxID=104777 RepID=A0A814EKH3_9BILA|nr:unnamed protein product [Brachionus calyciflorus]
MRRIAAIVVIFKNKKEKIGVAQLNITQEENESDDSNGEETDDEFYSDDQKNVENNEVNVIPSTSNELV